MIDSIVKSIVFFFYERSIERRWPPLNFLRRDLKSFFVTFIWGSTRLNFFFLFSSFLFPTLFFTFTMTFLSTLHRIAPVATSVSRAATTSVKPAFSAYAQKRFNSGGVTEVSEENVMWV